MSDYPKIYIHRERGFAYIPNLKRAARGGAIKKLISSTSWSSGKFKVLPWRSFRERNEWEKKFGCSLGIEWNGKGFGGLNLLSGKIYMDSKRGLKKGLAEFSEETKSIGIDFRIGEPVLGYAELCTFFPREYFPKAVEILKKFEKIFRTDKANATAKRHDSIEGWYVFITKNLLFGRYTVDVKVYKPTLWAGKKYNPNLLKGEDLSRVPKLEVQVGNPKEWSTAVAEVAPILMAFLDLMGCQSIPTTEADYELVKFPEKYEKGCQGFVSQFFYKKDAVVVYIPNPKDSDEIVKRRANIILFLKEKPRNIHEIKESVGVSVNTTRADLKILEQRGYVGSRGRRGVEKIYFPLPRMGV